MARFDSFIICTSPRSGSTLLCRSLAETGLSGAPGSHFHEPSLAAWAAHYEIEGRATEDETRAAVFAAAMAKGRGGTDVFGLRLQRHSFAYFVEQLGLMYPGDLFGSGAVGGGIRANAVHPSDAGEQTGSGDFLCEGKAVRAVAHGDGWDGD